MKYLGFLRAINVGKRRVKMDVLRGVVEGSGAREVGTYIASGNVIFEAEEGPQHWEGVLESTLEEGLGYPVATFVRTPQELLEIRDAPVFEGETREGRTCRVIFLKAPVEDAALEVLRTACDGLEARGRQVYWLYRREVGESRFSLAKFERALGVEGTMRNLTTVTKMCAKYPG